MGSIIAQIRADRGLTARQAADDAGMSPSHWRDIETRDSNTAQINTTQKMLRALGYELHILPIAVGDNES